MSRVAELLRSRRMPQVAVLLITAGFIMVNLLVDLSYAYLDPRIRYR